MLNSAHSSVKLFSFRLAATTNSTRCSCTLFVLQAILALSPGFLTVTPARLLRAKCKGCRGTFCKGCHGTGHLKGPLFHGSEYSSCGIAIRDIFFTGASRFRTCSCGCCFLRLGAFGHQLGKNGQKFFAEFSEGISFGRGKQQLAQNFALRGLILYLFAFNLSLHLSDAQRVGHVALRAARQVKLVPRDGLRLYCTKLLDVGEILDLQVWL